MRTKQKANSSQGTLNVSKTRSSRNDATVGGLMSSEPSTSNGLTTARMQMPLSTPTSSSASAQIPLDTEQQLKLTSDEQRHQLFAVNSKLCRLVRRNACLYDRQHSNYGKKHILDKTWLKIAKECDDTVSSCKERWRNMRAAYARSVNLYKTNTGPNRIKPYYLHEELSFLKEAMSEGRRNRPNHSVQENNQADDEEEFDEDDNNNDDYNQDQEDNEPNEIQTETDGGDDNDNDDDNHRMPMPIKSDGVSNSFLNGTYMCEITLEDLSSDGINTINDNKMDISQIPLKRRCFGLESEEHNAQQHRNNDIMTPSAENNNNNNGILFNNSPQKNIDCNNGRNCDKTTPAPSSSSTMRRERSSLDFCASSLECQHNSNVDMQFLNGLLPDMTAMSSRQKIIFKRKIYQILEEVFDDATDFPSKHDHHQYPNHNEAIQYSPLTSNMNNISPPLSSPRCPRLLKTASLSPRKTSSTLLHRRPPTLLNVRPSTSSVALMNQEQQQQQYQEQLQQYQQQQQQQQQQPITSVSSCSNIKTELKEDGMNEYVIVID